MSSILLLYYERTFGKINRFFEGPANKLIAFDVIFFFLEGGVKLQGPSITIGGVVDVEVKIRRVNLLFYAVGLSSF